MESPARSLKLPAGLDGPTRCRCRLGSQHGPGVRIAPEAKIASKRGRGCHGMWPYRLTPDHSGADKLGQGPPLFKCAFSIARGAMIGRRAAVPAIPDRRRPAARRPTSGRRARHQRRGATDLLATDRCQPPPDTGRRPPPTPGRDGSALNFPHSTEPRRIRNHANILDPAFSACLESAPFPGRCPGQTRTRCRTRRAGP